MTFFADTNLASYIMTVTPWVYSHFFFVQIPFQTGFRAHTFVSYHLWANYFTQRASKLLPQLESMQLYSCPRLVILDCFNFAFDVFTTSLIKISIQFTINSKTLVRLHEEFHITVIWIVFLRNKK